MSYNYLPLDRKRLHFKQVKNLLDYDQLVSITFDAHERILICRQYLDKISAVQNGKVGQPDEVPFELGKRDPLDLKELPADVMKLMLMLKIKSLSYGHSGVQIDTVKRLMEMYNNRLFPVIYVGSSDAENANALIQLCLPLTGLGQLHYNGQKRESLAVLKELNWQPISLKSDEWQALTTGTHLTTAFGLYALKKSEQLLAFADVIAALSFSALNCSVKLLDERLYRLRNHKGQINTAAKILGYIGASSAIEEENAGSVNHDFFSSTLSVNGAAKDSFKYVVNLFLDETNSVTETPVIFPDEDLVLNGAGSNERPMALALAYLATAIGELANISETRINKLVGGEENSSASPSIFAGIQFSAAETTTEIRQVSTTSSRTYILADSNDDFKSTGANIATKCLTILNGVEKVLAIELITIARLWERDRPNKKSPLLEELIVDFRQQVSTAGDNSTLEDDIAKARTFLQLYKLEDGV